MASSTTMAIASTSPNSVRVLMVNPISFITRECGDERHKMVSMGMMTGTPALKEEQNHQHHDKGCLHEGDNNVVDRTRSQIRVEFWIMR